jgi:ComF family protein
MGFPSLLTNLIKTLSGLIKSLTDFLFPKSQKVLVLEAMTGAEMLNSLPPAIGPNEENVIALFDYSRPVVREVIWEVKYGGNRVLAKNLGEILYDVIVSELGERGILSKEHSVLLIPMPVSGKRRFERGWNQAELLAEAIKACDHGGTLKYFPGQLVKTVHTESQTKTASKTERRHNLENTMRVVSPPSVAGKFVVLVDDVVTTGSTFHEARRALKEAGVRKVLCITVAH